MSSAPRPGSAQSPRLVARYGGISRIAAVIRRGNPAAVGRSATGPSTAAPAPRGPQTVASRRHVPEPAPRQPERDPGDSGPYFDAEATPFTVAGSGRAANPWMSDAAVPEQFLPWGSWDRPENVPSPRWERGETGTGGTGRLEAVPTVPVERTFWSRGGTGLALGAVTAGLGVAAVMWWNPVGWVALGAALAIAGGVAATTASAVELSASYSGATTAEQDARMNRAVSATLGYSSPGGVLGSVLGTVWADDPEEGFLQGGMWGGLIEGATVCPAHCAPCRDCGAEPCPGRNPCF